jgi:hypothetical protein
MKGGEHEPGEPAPPPEPRPLAVADAKRALIAAEIAIFGPGAAKLDTGNRAIPVRDQGRLVQSQPVPAPVSPPPIQGASYASGS